jgi:hypothetical protein
LPAVVAVAAVLALRYAREVEYPLEVAVEEEVVERPKVAVGERVLLHVGHVRVDLAVGDADDLLDRLPELV